MSDSCEESPAPPYADARYRGRVSIPVAPADLATALRDRGPGYLLTTTDGRVKVVTVEPDAEPGGTLHVTAPGRGSLRNITANRRVTLLFPPVEHHGYTLLVDGDAEAVGDDLVVTPDSAVLHRPAHHAPADGTGATGAPASSTACGDDCHPVA